MIHGLRAREGLFTEVTLGMQYAPAVFALDKPLGPTAAQALTALRIEDPSLATVKLGHTGRLDPMATGLLVVLVGDENRAVSALRGADKTYEVTVLFGVDTDSFDSLGLVRSVRNQETGADLDAVRRWCRANTGVIAQRAAPFSQARVHGKSLIALGHLSETVDRPVFERTVHSLSVDRIDALSGSELEAQARERTTRVSGNFRQAEISARWQRAMRDHHSQHFTLVTITAHTSTGTFMRSLAHDLGESLGQCAIAWAIRRTTVGALTLDGARTLRQWP